MPHKKQRSALGSSTAVEDYLEQILDLINTKGYARVADIALGLRISQASVTNMVQRLDAEGLLKYEKYRGLVLTTAGETLLASCRSESLSWASVSPGRRETSLCPVLALAAGPALGCWQKPLAVRVTAQIATMSGRIWGVKIIRLRDVYLSVGGKSFNSFCIAF